jgi:hypothetical protein
MNKELFVSIMNGNFDKQKLMMKIMKMNVINVIKNYGQNFIIIIIIVK